MFTSSSSIPRIIITKQMPRIAAEVLANSILPLSNVDRGRESVAIVDVFIHRIALSLVVGTAHDDKLADVKQRIWATHHFHGS